MYIVITCREEGKKERGREGERDYFIPLSFVVY